MTGEDLAFLAAAAVALVAAVGVVTRRSAIYAVLNLIVMLSSVGVIYGLLHAPFLAVIQVLVYAGAVVVLFLFVIMLLDLREMHRTDTGGLRLGPALVALAAYGILAAVVSRSPLVRSAGPAVESSAPGGVPWGGPAHMGTLLFGRFAFAFELVSVLILAAMIVAVVLARRENDVLPQDESSGSEATPPARDERAAALVVGEERP